MEYEGTRYEGVAWDELQDMVEDFEHLLEQAVEALEGLNDSYLETYVLNQLRSSGDGDLYGTLPEIVRAHVLEEG